MYSKTGRRLSIRPAREYDLLEQSHSQGKKKFYHGNINSCISKYPVENDSVFLNDFLKNISIYAKFINYWLINSYSLSSPIIYRKEMVLCEISNEIHLNKSPRKSCNEGEE